MQFVCDPVLGDHGRLYVPAEMVPLYRTLLVPHAHLLTPNLFEVAQLTGLPVDTQEQVCAGAPPKPWGEPAAITVGSGATTVCAIRSRSPDPTQPGGAARSLPREPDSLNPMQVEAAVEALHDMGATTVIVTSMEEGGREEAEHVVTLLASTRLPQQEGQPARFKLTAPRQAGRFTGTGTRAQRGVGTTPPVRKGHTRRDCCTCVS